MTKSQQLEQFIDGLGLRYFKGKEFTPYWSRTKRGVRNSVPPEALWPNIITTLLVLDEIRHRLGAGVTLCSTYRSPAYNAKLEGASKASFHMRFNAIDFSCSKGTPKEWAALARRLSGSMIDLPGGQGTFKFIGGIGTYPTFVHIDTRGQLGFPAATWG